MRRTIVHDFGMVSADELAFYVTAGYRVEGVSLDLTVSIHIITFTREIFILGMDVEGVRLRGCGAKFPAQVFTIHPKPELIGVGGLILHTVINIVVRYTGSCAKGNLTAKVGKEVKAVMVMVFCNGQFAMQHHPMNQVRQLTQSATDAL